MRFFLSLTFLACIGLCITALPAVAAENGSSPSKLEFLRDIRPILSNKCYRCHGPGTQEADLRLDIRDLALKDDVIVPGDVKKSKLIEKILADDDERMPPADAADRLSEAEVAKLRKWIEQGAEWAPHWAYATPKHSPLPALKNGDWARSPIDAFILGRLEQAKLGPSAEATRSTLIRRAYLDVLGVLPEPADVAAFSADERPDAYQRLVDRLLASPHFGERQSRHWLDLARYADSNGYTIDGFRSMWPYRDWVIQALNRDMPFDQFTAEQLAGDLLPGATNDQLIATGFHRNTPFNEEGGTDPEQFRVERTVDRTNTTGAVWLGLTLGCAQCHNHKYDEISQREYYQFYSFFNHADEAPPLRMPTPEQAARLQQLQNQLKVATDKQTALAKKPMPTASPMKTDFGDFEKETHGGWKTLQPLDAEAEHGTTLTILPDQSVLASGETPDTDLYTIRFRTLEGTFNGVRLEALTHDSLPKRGPGRAGNGNFVLSHFKFEVDDQEADFSTAHADYHQPEYEAKEALLNDPKQGWAINGVKGGSINVDRQAVFVAEKPIEIKPGQAITVTLRCAELPKKYLLGRFRISLTSASARVVALPVAAQQILFTPPSIRTAEQTKTLNHLLAVPMDDKRVKKEQDEVAALVKKYKEELKAFERTVPSSLVFKPPVKLRTTHIQLRGDFLSLGDEVQPGTLASLPPMNVSERLPNRLDLARWLTRPDNPLTPRVVVNRMWQQYFGKGLVETENDFGMQGTLPTHPELLDWLALGLTESDWSLKRMHRALVTSAVYRQSSVERDELRAKDPNNKLLGRQHRLRLEAEVIRDVALSASGLLTRVVGGPGVYPPQPAEVFSFTQTKKEWPESKGANRYRRGVYTFLWRQSLHPLFATFDGAEAQTACTRRNRSNTPLQALHLANDTAFVEIAEGLGQRVLFDKPNADEAERLDYAFQLCFARSAAADEKTRLLSFLEEQKAINAKTAWVMVARVLLNLDEFICRE